MIVIVSRAGLYNNNALLRRDSGVRAFAVNDDDDDDDDDDVVGSRGSELLGAARGADASRDRR